MPLSLVYIGAALLQGGQQVVHPSQALTAAES